MEKIDMSLDDIIKLNRKAKKKSIAQNNKTSTKKPGFKTQGKIGALRSKYATKGSNTKEKSAQQSNFSYQAATRQSVKKAKVAALKAKRKQQTTQVKGRQTARQTLLARRRGIEAQVKQLQSEAKKIQRLVQNQQQQINAQVVPETRQKRKRRFERQAYNQPTNKNNTFQTQRQQTFPQQQPVQGMKQKKKNRRFVRQPYHQATNNQISTFQTQGQQTFPQQQPVQGMKQKKKNRRFVRQPYHQATNNQISTFQTQGQQQQPRQKQKRQKWQQPQQQQPQVNTQKSKRGRRFNRWKGNNTNASSPSLLTVSVNSKSRPLQQSHPVNLNRSGQQKKNAVSLNERFGVSQQYNTPQQRNRSQQQRGRRRHAGQTSRTVLMTGLQ